MTTRSVNQRALLLLNLLLGLAAGLAVIWFVVHMWAAIAGPPRLTLAVDKAVVGGAGPLQLTANQPLVQAGPVEAVIDGVVAASVQLEGSALSLAWHQALVPGQHELSLTGDLAGLDGARLAQPFLLPFEVRPVELVFLRPEPGKRWLVRTNAEQQIVLFDRASVHSYAADPSGERIIVAAANATGGTDLWSIDRQAAEVRRLFDCGADHCQQPAWSPDAARIVFVRLPADARGDIQRARLWTIDAAGEQAAPLYQEAGRAGTDPVWSPDGRWLAYYDPVGQAVLVLDSDTVTEQIIPTAAGTAGAWSVTSDELALPVLDLAHDGPEMALLRVNVVARTTATILAAEAGWSAIGEPAWSPAQGWLAAAASRTGLGHGVWRFRPDGSQLEAVALDSTYAYGGLAWDPWGEQLLFQRFPIGGDGGDPQLLVWDPSAGFVRQIESATLGQWLP